MWRMKWSNIWFPFKALGGLASQCFQQRVLSSSSGTTAKISCFAAALLYLVLGIPPILLGAGAASTGENSIATNNVEPTYEKMTSLEMSHLKGGAMFKFLIAWSAWKQERDICRETENHWKCLFVPTDAGDIRDQTDYRRKLQLTKKQERPLHNQVSLTPDAFVSSHLKM